jgi:hypothetical protein
MWIKIEEIMTDWTDKYKAVFVLVYLFFNKDALNSLGLIITYVFNNLLRFLINYIRPEERP